jgi:hypothetical protein
MLIYIQIPVGTKVMATHIEKNASKQRSESRQEAEDARAEEGREVWRAAVEATEVNAEGRQELQDDADTVLDEIDEVLESGVQLAREVAAAQQRRQSTAESIAGHDAAVTAGLGQVVLVDDVIHDLAA